MPAMHSRASHSDIAKLLWTSAFCASRAGRLGCHNARVSSHSVLEPGALVQKAHPSSNGFGCAAIFNALTVPPQAGFRICAKSLRGIDPAKCWDAQFRVGSGSGGSMVTDKVAGLGRRGVAGW